MPFNGVGTYLPAGADYPVVTLTVISSLHYNNVVTDMSTALSTCVTKDGQTTWTANLPAGGFKLTGLGAGAARTDSANMANVQDGLTHWVVAGGTADAITATYSPAITTLVDGQICGFRATAANATTTPTFAPNGLTARTITKYSGAALAAGDITGAFSEIILRYNLANTRWEILNPRPPVIALGTARQVLTINAGASAATYSDPITLVAEQATTSGTTIDFTGIPAGVKRISIMLNAVSLSAGTDRLQIQIGISTGVETTNYLSCAANNATFVGSTTGFVITTGGGGNVASSGTITLTLQKSSTNTWCASGVLCVDTLGTPGSVFTSGGRKSLAGVLDRIRLTNLVGTETFDAGSVSISYE